MSRFNMIKPYRISPRSSLFVSVLSMALVVINPLVASAELNAPDYVHSNPYKQINNIYFYEKMVSCMPGTGISGDTPTALNLDSPTTSSTLPGDTTGAQAYNYLIGKGLSPVQAMGVLGNLMQESGGKTLNINPDQHQIGGGPGYGLAQWEGPRKTDLYNFAKSQGKPVSDLGLQLDFIWKELNDPYYKKNTLDPLLAATNLDQAVSIVLNNYERPKIRDLENRTNLAMQAAQQLGIDLGSALANVPYAGKELSNTVVNCAPPSEEPGEKPSGAPSSGGAPTGENGKLDTSQLAKVTIACSGSWSEPYLTVEASAALTQLNAAFKQKFGRDMHGISCYRSYDKQVEAKAYWTAQGKPGNAATPGTSNHGWGLAIDLQSKPGTPMTYGSAEYKWLMQNAGTYGYCNPKNMQQGGSGPHEPWHWQYQKGC